jgi:hypothetical protein
LYCKKVQILAVFSIPITNQLTLQMKHIQSYGNHAEEC